ncbi:MAG: aquaporin [Bryobacteraceae bacterium]|nr:aquaporin [Bryobacteraceae bacterium]
MPAATPTLQPQPRTIAAHWPEYAMEGAELALFMLSACSFGVLLEHPMSPLHQAIDSAFLRRLVMGLAMAVTLVAIVQSRWGQRSGAHLNPALTFNYWLLGKVNRTDALGYIAAQFLGGAFGVWLASLLIGPPLGHTAVNYVATLPGDGGSLIAFVAEFAISCFLMTTVLVASNSVSLRRLTPYLAGILVALYIAFEAPLSGMSMNPARTLGSALAAGDFNALWVYFSAPLLGMGAAAFLYAQLRGVRRVYCAKLHHHNRQRCIFRCNYEAMDVESL